MLTHLSLPLNGKPCSFTTCFSLGMLSTDFSIILCYSLKILDPRFLCCFPSTVVLFWVLLIVTWTNKASNTLAFQFLDVHNSKAHSSPWAILSSWHLKECFCEKTSPTLYSQSPTSPLHLGVPFRITNSSNHSLSTSIEHLLWAQHHERHRLW